MKSATSAYTSHAWITFATFNRLDEAQQLLDRLLQAGLTARLQDERRLQRIWFLARPVAGIHVLVSEPCFLGAQRWVDEDPQAQSLLGRAVHCPSCESPRVQFPAFTRKNILPALIGQVLVLVGLTRQECYCEACHFTWVPGKTRRGKAISEW